MGMYARLHSVEDLDGRIFYIEDKNPPALLAGGIDRLRALAGCVQAEVIPLFINELEMKARQAYDEACRAFGLVPDRSFIQTVAENVRDYLEERSSALSALDLVHYSNTLNGVLEYHLGQVLGVGQQGRSHD